MELKEFFFAVLNTWAEKVGIILTILPFIEKMPRVKEWLHDKPFIDRYVSLLYYIGAFFLLWGFYAAWKEQHHAVLQAQQKLEEMTKPKFEIAIGQSISWYDTERKATFWLPLVTVTNRQAPSAILGWEINYKSPTLNQKVEFADFNDVLKLPSAIGSIEIDPANMINVKRGAIPQGDFRDGRLAVMIPGERNDEISRGQAVIYITVTDYLGHPHTGQFIGKKEENIRLMPGEKVIKAH